MGMTLNQLSNLDLCYAPPYSLAVDNIITAANIITNKISGFMEGITPKEVKKLMDSNTYSHSLTVDLQKKLSKCTLKDQ